MITDPETPEPPEPKRQRISEVVEVRILLVAEECRNMILIQPALECSNRVAIITEPAVRAIPACIATKDNSKTVAQTRHPIENHEAARLLPLTVSNRQITTTKLPHRIIDKSAFTITSDTRRALWQGMLKVFSLRFAVQAAPYEKRLKRASECQAKCNTKLLRQHSRAVEREAQTGIDKLLTAVQVCVDSALRVVQNETNDVNMLLRLRKLAPEAPAELLGLASEARVRHASFEFDRCTNCGSALHMVIADHSLICPGCGARSECPDPGGMAQSVTYYNLDRRPSLLSHRRLPKLKEFLKQLLAKQKSVVPMGVLLDVTAHLVRNNDRASPDGVTFAAVRAALGALGMRNFMDYGTQIYCRIKGCAPPAIAAADEEALFVLFVAIQEPFESIKERKSSTFFSMSYVVLTLCRFLQLDSIVPFIPLTIARTRVHTQQNLLRKIFQQLGWSPFPELFLEKGAMSTQ